MGLYNILSKIPGTRKFWYNLIYNRTASKQRKEYNFEISKLKELKNILNGESCFIIGTGPTLTIKDLLAIENAGFVTFAPNRIYEICEKTGWSPTYYICQDHKIIQTFKDRIKGIKSKISFFPVQYQSEFVGDNYRFFVLHERDYYPKSAKFSMDVSKEIAQGYTVTYGAIQLAIYMGFKKIYLIGMDHNYAITRDSKGRPVRNAEDVKNYPSGMTDYINQQNLPRIEESTIAYETAERESKKLGVKIYNATRGGKLEAFERISLDEVLNKNPKR